MNNKSSDWRVYECQHCHQIFSVPYEMVCEEGENYRYLICPYCGTDGDNQDDDKTKFISSQQMDCEINKITKWEVK